VTKCPAVKIVRPRRIRDTEQEHIAAALTGHQVEIGDTRPTADRLRADQRSVSHPFVRSVLSTEVGRADIHPPAHGITLPRVDEVGTEVDLYSIPVVGLIFDDLADGREFPPWVETTDPARVVQGGQIDRQIAIELGHVVGEQAHHHVMPGATSVVAAEHQESLLVEQHPQTAAIERPVLTIRIVFRVVADRTALDDLGTERHADSVPPRTKERRQVVAIEFGDHRHHEG
jgi:hypothetical protein